MATYLGKRDASASAPEAIEFMNNVKTLRNRLTEVYLFLADDCTETSESILASTDLPAIDTSDALGRYIYKRTPKEVATVINPSTGAKSILWEVTVESDDQYENVSTSGGSGTTADLLSAAPVESWDSVVEDELLLNDLRTGKPFQTVNGEPIIVMRKVFYPVLNIQRIETHPFDPLTIHNYSNRVNSKPFRGVAKGWAMMLPPKAEPFQHGETILEKVTYQIKFRTEGITLSGTTIDLAGNQLANESITPFMTRVLHQGTLYKPIEFWSDTDPGHLGNEVRRWLDSQGNPGTVNLTKEGGLNTDQNNLVFIAGHGHKEADFDTLGL